MSKVDFVAIIIFLTLPSQGCRNGGVSSRVTSEDNPDTQEIAGAGEPTAVAGTNLVPVCDITDEKSVLALADRYMDCQIYACSAVKDQKTCQLASRPNISRDTYYGWEDSNSLVSECSTSSDKLRRICRNSTMMIFRTRAAGAQSEVARRFIESTALSIKEKSLKAGSVGATVEFSWTNYTSLPQVKDAEGNSKSVTKKETTSYAAILEVGTVPNSPGKDLVFKVTFSSFSAGGIGRVEQTARIAIADKTEVDSGYVVPTQSAPNVLYAFVTSSTYPGNFGGLSAADAICEQHANQSGSLYVGRGLGKFRALLSSSSLAVGSPSRLKLYSSAPLKITNNLNGSGTELRSPSSELFNGLSLGSTWLYDEFGNPVPSTPLVWTGSTSVGNADPLNCTNWTVDGFSVQGRLGYRNAQDSGWISGSAAVCQSSAHLYCIGGQD